VNANANRRRQLLKACGLIAMLLILVASVVSIASAQTSIDGHWEGRLVWDGAELERDFKNQPAGAIGLFSSRLRRQWND